jgi:hypothetical protein
MSRRIWMFPRMSSTPTMCSTRQSCIRVGTDATAALDRAAGDRVLGGEGERLDATLRAGSTPDIHLVSWRLNNLSFEADKWDPGCQPLGDGERGPDWEEPMRVGAKLGKFPIPSACAGRVHFRGHFELGATLDNGYRVDTVIERIVTLCKAVLDEIDRVL